MYNAVTVSKPEESIKNTELIYSAGTVSENIGTPPYGCNGCNCLAPKKMSPTLEQMFKTLNLVFCINSVFLYTE